MSSSKISAQSTASWTSFTLSDGISDYDTMSNTKEGSKPGLSAQETHPPDDQLQEKRGVRCRIQWLGGASQFLAPFTSESRDSKLVVTQLNGGSNFSVAEWSLNWHNDTSECTIQSIRHDSQFVSGAYLSGNETLLNLCRVHPPLNSAKSTMCEDIQEEWTCLISFDNSTRLSVLGSLVTLTQATAPVTKNDIWRVQLLRDTNISRDSIPSPQTSRPRFVMSDSIAEPRSIVSPSGGKRCWLVTHMKGGKEAYLQAGPDGTLYGVRRSVTQDPTEWYLTPSGIFYTIQLAQDMSYLSHTSHVKLGTLPTKWKISRANEPLVSQPDNIEEQWTCTIHPAAKPDMLLKTQQKIVALSQLPAAHNMKDKHRWRILFLKEDDSGPSPRGLANNEPTRHMEPDTPTVSRANSTLTRHLYCRISCEMTGGTMYLAVDQDDYELVLLSRNPPEWILSPTDGGYKIHLSGESHSNLATNTLWALKESVQTLGGSTYKRPSDVLQVFTCELRRNSSKGPSLKGLCGYNKKGSLGTVIDYTCGMVIPSYSSQPPQWRVEVLREQIVNLEEQNGGSLNPQQVSAQRPDSPRSASNTVFTSATSPNEQGNRPVVGTPPPPSASSIAKLDPLIVPSPGSQVPRHVLDWVNNCSKLSEDPTEREDGTTTPRARAEPHPSIPTDKTQTPKQAGVSLPKEDAAQAEDTPAQHMYEPAEQGQDSSATSSHGVRQCRIQHLLSEAYLTLQTSGAELVEFANADTWMMQPAGPGYMLMTRASGQMSYLAPMNDDVGKSMLGSSNYPAPWDISQRHERQTITPGVEKVEWICKLFWPFTGQLILAESAENSPAKLNTNSKSHYVWLSELPGAETETLGRLREYWRIQFLVGP